MGAQRGEPAEDESSSGLPVCLVSVLDVDDLLEGGADGLGRRGQDDSGFDGS